MHASDCNQEICFSYPNVKHVCPLFVCSVLSLKTAHEHLSTSFLNFDKNYVGHDVRKTVFRALRTTKAQTSLSSDLEITQHRRRYGHDHFLGQKGFSRTTFWRPNMLIWSGYFFQFPLDFLMR